MQSNFNKLILKQSSGVLLLSGIYLLIFNKSWLKVHYLDWSIGLLFFTILILNIIFYLKLKRDEFKVFIVIFLWLLPASVVYFYVEYGLSHLYNVFERLVIDLSFFSLLVLMVKINNFQKFINLSFKSWVLINYIFLVLLLVGINTSSEDTDIFSGIFHYKSRNYFAIQCILMQGLFFVFGGKGRFDLIYIVMNSILILLSQSLTGAILLSVFSLIVLDRWLYRLGVVILFSAFIFFFHGIFNHLSNNFVQTLFFLQNSVGEGSVGSRAWLVINGFHLFQENSWSGIGIGNSKYYLLPLERVGTEWGGMHTHNNYLESLLELGYVGFLLHYSPIAYVLIRGKNNRNGYSFSILIYLYLVAGAFSLTTGLGIARFTYIIIIYGFFADFRVKLPPMDSLRCD